MVFVVAKMSKDIGMTIRKVLWCRSYFVQLLFRDSIPFTYLFILVLAVVFFWRGGEKEKYGWLWLHSCSL